MRPQIEVANEGFGRDVSVLLSNGPSFADQDAVFLADRIFNLLERIQSKQLIARTHGSLYIPLTYLGDSFSSNLQCNPWDTRFPISVCNTYSKLISNK